MDDKFFKLSELEAFLKRTETEPDEPIDLNADGEDDSEGDGDVDGADMKYNDFFDPADGEVRLGACAAAAASVVLTSQGWAAGGFR